MICGGYFCSKHSLVALNIIYFVIAIILIAVGASAKVAGYITELPTIGGIIACGVFLLLVAILGLVGALKHHQVLLFFYMIILFLIFLVQFGIACACLAINAAQQKEILKRAWDISPPSGLSKAQEALNCCGFDQQSKLRVSCHEISCCKNSQAACCAQSQNRTFRAAFGNNADDTTIPLLDSTSTNLSTAGSFTTKPTVTVSVHPLQSCPCQTCWAKELQRRANGGFKLAGGFGLFFSLTEIIGVWLALRFRNQRDPTSDATTFLEE